LLTLTENELWRRSGVTGRRQGLRTRSTAEDAIYISLNFEDPELKRVMPWTGTSSGPEAFISTFTRVATYWTIEAFEISDLFGSAEDVAVFGSFTYRSVSLGQAVRSPFSIHATVKDGKIAFFQFIEDTFATARSFRSNGAWASRRNPTDRLSR
jgi:ketosteroid isomerase-like protein